MTFKEQVHRLEADYWHLLDIVINNKKITTRYKREIQKEYEELTLKRNKKISTGIIKYFYTAQEWNKLFTNKKITRDSILEHFQNEYKYLDEYDIKFFLDLLSEQTLEIILKDIKPNYLKRVGIK